jgi:hypothetical protein
VIPIVHTPHLRIVDKAVTASGLPRERNVIGPHARGLSVDREFLRRNLDAEEVIYRKILWILVLVRLLG